MNLQETVKSVTERVNMSPESQSKLQAQTNQKKKGKQLVAKMKDIADDIDRLDWELVNSMGINIASVKALYQSAKKMVKEIKSSV